MDRLASCGFEAFAVGGCIRDSLLGKDPKDWDICTSATPDEIKACFSGLRVLETGVKHGTLTVLTGGMPMEVTTYRVDGPYLDNRRPSEVLFVGDIEQDLSRRDFTVNAMAYNPARRLVDPFGGREDLDAQRLRCVGDPDARFREDALRILRALRFASVLGFTVQEATAKSIHDDRELLRNISAERICAELTKLLCGGGAERILLEYPDVLGVFIPELLPTVGFDQNNPHHVHDVWTHTAAAVAGVPEDAFLRLAMLFHDFGKPGSYTEDGAGIGHFYGHPAKSAEMAREIMKRLRYDNDTVETVSTLVLHHDATIKPEPGHILKWLGRLGLDNYRRLLQIKLADAAAQNPEEYPETAAEISEIRAQLDRILAERRCFSLRDLAVNGDDLIALGIPRGARIGAALKALLDMVIEKKVENEREELLEAAKSLGEE
jgi:tRNA nucleotidyltransferase (CCA-adding enzyme)